MANELSIFNRFDDDDDQKINKKTEEQLTRVSDDEDQPFETAEQTDKTVDIVVEETREQTAETQQEMNQTINQIQEHLSVSDDPEPAGNSVSGQIGGAVETIKQNISQKSEDAANVVGEGFRRIEKSGVVRTARENPWILGAVGLGIGALAASFLVGKKKKSANHRRAGNYDLGDVNVMKFSGGYDDVRAPDDDRDFDADEVRLSDDYRRDLKSGEAENTESPEERGSIAQTAGAAFEGVSGAAGKTYQGVSRAANFAYDKAGDFGGQVKTNYDYYIEENPLLVGAAVFAAGAAIGAAIPLTRAENDFFGAMRDDTVDKIQKSAQQAIDTAKQIVGEAQKAFADEVIEKMK